MAWYDYSAGWYSTVRYNLPKYSCAVLYHPYRRHEMRQPGGVTYRVLSFLVCRIVADAAEGHYEDGSYPAGW